MTEDETEALLVKERASSPGVRNVTAHALAMMQAGKSPLGQKGVVKLCSTHSLGVSDYLQPHGLQHARLPCPSPTPGAYSNSSPSSQ